MTTVTEVNGWQLGAVIGRGSTGVVHRAERDGATIAVKLLADGLRRDPSAIAALRAEAHLLELLRHPRIVSVLWIADTQDMTALGMDLIDGVPLRRVLASGSTTPETALLVLRGSLEALDHAHRQGVVHRDYKPENVLVDRAGGSHVIDFGIAITRGQPGAPAGTPAYAAPEQWQGAPASPQADVYAATAVVYECLTGRRAFTGTSIEQLRAQHLTGEVDYRPVPESIQPLVRRGLAVDPRQRPGSAAELLAELEDTARQSLAPDWAVLGATALAAASSAAALAPSIVAAAATPSAGHTGAAGRRWAIPVAVAGVLLLALLVLFGHRTPVTPATTGAVNGFAITVSASDYGGAADVSGELTGISVTCNSSGAPTQVVGSVGATRLRLTFAGTEAEAVLVEFNPFGVSASSGPNDVLLGSGGSVRGLPGGGYTFTVDLTSHTNAYGSGEIGGTALCS